MKWVTLVAMGLVLAGCSKQSETPAEAKVTGIAPDPAKIEEAKLEEAAKTPAKTERTVTLNAGTRVRIRTNSTISSETAQSGDAFTGSLADPLVVDGKEIAPKGADVFGVVTNSDDGGRVKGLANVGVRLSRIEVNGKQVPVQTGVFVKNAPATKKKDAVTVGIGAGVGAAIGAIAGGGKGAAIGAASGAGAGTGVVLATRGKPAVIGAESLITFRLTAPVSVNVAE